jgi:hypothetical protein
MKYPTIFGSKSCRHFCMPEVGMLCIFAVLALNYSFYEIFYHPNFILTDH